MAAAGAYDVFVSHCKRLDASEDRAVWVADVCEDAGLKVFFDRSDLTDISEEVLARSVKESRVVVTVLDPHTFESDWVVKENRWAAEAGRPIVPIYDGDRHRWDTIKKCAACVWLGSRFFTGSRYRSTSAQVVRRPPARLREAGHQLQQGLPRGIEAAPRRRRTKGPQ